MIYTFRPLGTWTEKVDFDGPIPQHRPDLGPCWLWTGALNAKGHAERVSIDGRRILPHRLAWEIAHGPIPDGLVIDHLCRVRNCVNAAHLEPVTTQVNTRRGGRTLRDVCPQGHRYDEANTRRYRGRRYCRACNNNGGDGRQEAKRILDEHAGAA